MKGDQPKGETGIMWLENPHEFRFVRVVDFSSFFFNNPPKKLQPTDTIVGYTTGGEREYEEYPYKLRRMFYVRDYDLATYLDCCPMEGVDPLTLAPNEPGIVTERAWNGPLNSPTDRGEA